MSITNADFHCRMAKVEGLPLAVNSAAQSVHAYDNRSCGIGQARRGRLQKAGALNTRPLPRLLAWLRREEEK